MEELISKVEPLLNKIKETIYNSKRGNYKQKLSADQLFYFQMTALSLEYRLGIIKLCVKCDDLAQSEKIAEENKAEIIAITEDFKKFTEKLAKEFGL